MTNGDGRYPEVDQRLDPPAIDRRVLERWDRRRVFERSLQAASGAPTFTFYEGPPTANGSPGVHHVEARVFKDVFPRYLTMKGYSVPRRAGWDCHGIPVELEVERELGLADKRAIEDYGIERFNDKCRSSVQRYVSEFEELTRRIGYWVDTNSAYWTMSRSYMESVWWSLQQLYQRGYLYEADRVVPYCPRCGTALSDHEVSQGYAETDDHSIFVRFPLLSGRLSDEGADLLIWTTMPWTLVPATLAVVGPDIRYVLAVGGHAKDRPVVIAADAMERVLGPDAEVVREVPVDELVGTHYNAPFDFVGPGSADDPDGDPQSWRYVVADGFVRTEGGTGIVHTGAAFGEDDMRVALGAGVPVVKPVDGEGRFDGRVGRFAGMYVRDADGPIVEELANAGLLLSSGTHRHTFPFCWRCTTPLLYYAKPSWYLATTRVRDDMLAHNDHVAWHPDNVREGRFGEWLAGNVDWAISRERYWGTPLPLWRCTSCEETTCVGSLRELAARAGQDLADVDLHRPAVDHIPLPCRACDGTAFRVPQVIDAWYDSGAMPFAQHGYPHRPGSTQAFDAAFPADFVCEGIDQTRGWFYSLLAVSTMVFGAPSYQRALCLGHLVDDEGRKMSKSAGNALDPNSLLDRHGADALRWLLLVEGSPWQSRRISDEAVQTVSRRVFGTLWNTLYFFATYANLSAWQPPPSAPPLDDIMDRWITSELADCVRRVAVAMDAYDTATAGRRLATFIDDLSNWYVRRSRDRFSPRHRSSDSDTAFHTLHRCLVTVARLTAPFAPFISDEMHEILRNSDPTITVDSVHLERFPEPSDEHDPALRDAMAAARILVRLGRDARNSAGMPVRQPLHAAIAVLPSHVPTIPGPVLAVVAAELNVKDVSLPSDRSTPVSRTVGVNYARLGPRFGKLTPAIARAVAVLEPEQAAQEIEESGCLTVEADGETLKLDPEHVEFAEQPQTGWELSSNGGYSVALNTELDRDLQLEGVARELSRGLNELRRSRRFALQERVQVVLALDHDPDGTLSAAVERFHAVITDEVHATSIDTLPAGQQPRPGPGAELAIGAGTVTAALTRD